MDQQSKQFFKSKRSPTVVAVSDMLPCLKSWQCSVVFSKLFLEQPGGPNCPCAGGQLCNTPHSLWQVKLCHFVPVVTAVTGTHPAATGCLPPLPTWYQGGISSFHHCPVHALLRGVLQDGLCKSEAWLWTTFHNNGSVLFTTNTLQSWQPAL